MELNPAIKRNWIELQKKCEFPVNAIGIKISSNDTKTLKVWREEGIDNFMRR